MKEQGVYRADIVTQLQGFYGDLLWSGVDFSTITKHLQAIAERHVVGIKKKIPCTFVELNNYHPKFIGKSVSELRDYKIELEDSYDCIAFQYGFTSWTDLRQKANCPYNRSFEIALSYLLNGELKKLMNHLDNNNDLINQASLYGHRATLLHYTASNGVELWRQQTPINLPDLISILIEKGANTSAKMKVYGGEYDTLALLTSSAHPYKAGIGKKAEHVLRNQIM